MKKQPRPFAEPLLTRSHWIRIVLHGVVIAVIVLAAMAIAVTQLGSNTEQAVSISFCTLTLAQVWHVFNMRDNIRKPFVNEITRNVWIWLAVATCILLLLAAVYVPWLSDVLEISHPGAEGWLLIIGMSVVPILVAPIVRRAAMTLH